MGHVRYPYSLVRGLVHWFRGQDLPRLRSGPVRPRLPHGRLLTAEGWWRHRAEEPLHPLREMRPRLPGGRHLSRRDGRALCLHPLRPVRFLLPP